MKKIAFCFLTYENISKPELWNNFFFNKNSKCNIYIHNKYPFIDNNYHFEKYCIDNCVETKYAHISLIKATTELFKNAMADSENEYFVLLSESCIPLYNFDYIYNIIQEMNTNIIQSVCNNNMERFNDLTNQNFFNKNNFAKQNACMILNRSTANFFIKNDFTYLFSDNFYAPDEHYFVNLLNKYNIPYVNSNINYSYWEWNHTGRPKTYYQLTYDEIKDVKSNGFLFMRKINKDCILPHYF